MKSFYQLNEAQQNYARRKIFQQLVDQYRKSGAFAPEMQAAKDSPEMAKKAWYPDEGEILVHGVTGWIDPK